MENNELKKVSIKNCIYYDLDDIIRLEDFDSDKFLLGEKIFDNIFWFTTFHTKLW